MPAPLSIDLRRRIIAAWQDGEGTWDEIAERFAVGVASVDRLVRRFRKSETVVPLPHAGGVPPKIGDDGLVVVRRLLQERSDLTDDELVYGFKEETGITVSPATMGRAVRRLGFTRKKKPSSRRSVTGRA
jgi:transposase